MSGCWYSLQCWSLWDLAVTGSTGSGPKYVIRFVTLPFLWKSLFSPDRGRANLCFFSLPYIILHLLILLITIHWLFFPANILRPIYPFIILTLPLSGACFLDGLIRNEQNTLNEIKLLTCIARVAGNSLVSKGWGSSQHCHISYNILPSIFHVFNLKIWHPRP